MPVEPPKQTLWFAPACAASVPAHTTVIVPFPPAATCEVSQANPVGNAGRVLEANEPARVPPNNVKLSPKASGLPPPSRTTVSAPASVSVPLDLFTLSAASVIPILLTRFDTMDPEFNVTVPASERVVPAEAAPAPGARMPPDATTNGPLMVPLPPKVPPELTVTVLPAASEPGLLTRSLPPFIVVAPV